MTRAKIDDSFVPLYHGATEWRGGCHEGSKGSAREAGKGLGTKTRSVDGLVAAHKPTLRTITVTNHIVFVATTHRNTS